VNSQNVTIRTDTGQVITALATSTSTIQVGAADVSRPGYAFNLAKWYEPGDFVNIQIDGNTLASISRLLRPGEGLPSNS
jgi:hypothetical protein